MTFQRPTTYFAKPVTLDDRLYYARATKAYNGAVGCMCGCKGNYAYASGQKPADWQGNVNQRTVRARVAKVVRLAQSGAYDRLDVTDSYVAVVVGNRQTVVYFN